MPKVHFVEKARKDNPAVKKGESYFWFKPMVNGRGGAKQYFKTRPARWQVTQSAYYSRLWQLIDTFTPSYDEGMVDDLENIKQELSELMDETQESFDNMPDGLAEGDAGQLLQERIDALEDCISTLENIDTDWDGEDQEFWNGVAEEIESALSSADC